MSDRTAYGLHEIGTCLNSGQDRTLQDHVSDYIRSRLSNHLGYTAVSITEDEWDDIVNNTEEWYTGDALERINHV